MAIRLLSFLFLILCSFGESLAQKQNLAKDSTINHSTDRPKAISGELIHKAFLKSSIRKINYSKEYLGKNPIPYPVVEGKIIRSIHITPIDPFGYSLQDTSIYPVRFFSKLGNRIHLASRKEIINKLLLFRPGEPFDSLSFKESVRLIRSQKYVHDVLAYTSFTSPEFDSIDIHIRTIDVWSIVPKLQISESNQEMGLADNNFLGSGNRLHFNTRLNNNLNGPVLQMGYMISNIRNSHITGNLEYFISGNNDLINYRELKRPVYSPINYNLPTQTLSQRYLVKSIELSRSFFSPLTRWAGGIYIGQLVTSQNYIDNDSISELSSHTNIQDIWAAWSWPLYKGNSLAARTTNIVLSARMLRTRYPGRLPITESLNLFNRENLYFAGIGITSRRYTQDRYVFNYGKIEDVPVGRAFGITTGFNIHQNNLIYLGLKFAMGNYYRFGYLSNHIEYGTLIGNKEFRQQVITIRMNYYTPLFSLGYWKVRQFIKPTAIFGINRLPTDNLTLSEGMQDFEELNTPATRMMALTLQTQSYAPWEMYGFRFGPYVFSSLGMLGHRSSDISDKRLYAVLGLGVLIKNNYLLINTFQLSFSYYPFLPGRGYDIVNLNAYKTTDYGFSNFEIGKPQVVDYR